MTTSTIPPAVLGALNLNLLGTIYQNASTGRCLYKASRGSVHGNYALKVFLPGFFNERELDHEITAVNRLPFGLAPRCHAKLIKNKTGYLVFDWVEGMPLSEAFRSPPRGRSQLAQRFNLLEKLCRKVGDINRNRVLHRDLKPDNVLVSGRRDTPDRINVIDFGLSAQKRQSTEGTYLYQAPEQYGDRDLNLSNAVDVFALGQIGWFLASGEPLKRQPNLDYSDWADTPLPELEEPLSPPLVQVLNKAMAMNPRNRFRNATDLANALKNARQRGR